MSLKRDLLYYYTPKLGEIKPQRKESGANPLLDYYTPKLEIKPQLSATDLTSACNFV